MTYPSAYNLLATYQTPSDGPRSDQHPTYGTLLTQVKVGLPVAFALGWAGGYLAWVGIGKYQARQETKRTEETFRMMNRKVPFKSRFKKENWRK